MYVGAKLYRLTERPGSLRVLTAHVSVFLCCEVVEELAYI